MATATLETARIPVPVLEYPHWRVHFQPDRYKEDRIPSLGRCVELVQQCNVSLRGWSFPQLSPRDEDRAYATSYLSGWANFMGTIEYWRLYQSGQFVHLNAISETTRPDFRKALEEAARFHLRGEDIDWAAVPGYLSFLNFFYRVIEIFEFAARLSEKGIYDSELEISIELKRVKGFVLTADQNRAWSEFRYTDTEDLGRSWTVTVPALIADRSELSLKAAVWFFERFHWLNPPLAVLRREQQNFLRGVV